MISLEHLDAIAVWAVDLTEEERERARRGIIERDYAKGSYICHRGDRLDYWTSVVTGLVKLGAVSAQGKSITLAGLGPTDWFGEGSMIKDEPRKYDLFALRDTRLAMMDRKTFNWLFQHSVGLNHYLVRQFNERLGQFIGKVEQDRSLGPAGRLARALLQLINPVGRPKKNGVVAISQEELGLLAGISRPAANKAIRDLETRGLIRTEPEGVRVLDHVALENFED
ncbi:Crp/Fnr family transcriptional regulator [Terrarubrum flagellatum]|uniref:Crp/Fnr family transcriptional regulator n=1 Tax=Terrirubrum flagellatum TaxID=2895980 RepID=UPI003144F9B4